MKRGLLAVVVAGLALAVAVGASGAAKTVTATFTGKCTEIDTLDHNGALASARNNCSTLAKGRFAGATQLELGTFESESGTGAPGVVHGTLLVTGPQGSVTLALRGKRTCMTTSKGAPYVQETGTLDARQGLRLPGRAALRSGVYSTIMQTLSMVTGTKVSLVKVTGSFGCWNCGST